MASLDSVLFEWRKPKEENQFLRFYNHGPYNLIAEAAPSCSDHGCSSPKPDVITLLEQEREPWMVMREGTRSWYTDLESKYVTKKLFPEKDICEIYLFQLQRVDKSKTYIHEDTIFRNDLQCKHEFERQEGHQMR
ncbi:hypothetical protein E2I00_006659, partial [Balaenoptera physalus]